MIYLDNNASTKPTDEVVNAMRPFWEELYGNPSGPGSEIMGAVDPRRQCADSLTELLNAEDPRCFVFTSGATESNNWVFATQCKRAVSGRRVVISSVEHPSVLEPAKALHASGFDIIEVPVDSEGVIEMEQLRDALSPSVSIVSIMAANNETGTLQPIQEISELVREVCPSALVHTDATQAVGKIPIDLQTGWPEVDLLSFSGHKFHGPKGIGGLYIRPGIELQPFILGGGQENGLRSGTSNSPSLAGLAVAAKTAASYDTRRITGMRDAFETKLKKVIPSAVIHSERVNRLPNTSFFSLPGLDPHNAVAALINKGILVGTGAACSSGALDASRTLRAMGVDSNIARSSLRMSLSMFNNEEELSKFLFYLRKLVVSGALDEG